jgi:hypothetical protein
MCFRGRELGPYLYYIFVSLRLENKAFQNYNLKFLVDLNFIAQTGLKQRREKHAEEIRAKFGNEDNVLG